MVHNVPPKATDQLISTPMGQEVTINLAGIDPDSEDDLTTALIKDPEGGRLGLSNGDWSFFPDAGFTGRVNIPFTVFDGIALDDGLISIDVTEP
jgi:hypothetical protein